MTSVMDHIQFSMFNCLTFRFYANYRLFTKNIDYLLSKAIRGVKRLKVVTTITTILAGANSI